MRREPVLPEHEGIAPEEGGSIEPIDDEPRMRFSDSASCRARLAQSHVKCHPTPATTRRCNAHAHQAHFQLPPDLTLQLVDYAARKRVPQALVVEAALASRRPPACRLDRMTRQMELIARHVTVSNEGLAGSCISG